MVDLSRYKNIISKLYDGKCTIIVYKAITDPVTHRKDKAKEIIKYRDIPCRLSHKGTQTVQQVEGGKIGQQIKLILDNNIVVEPNSKIVVTQVGTTKAYKNSGVSQVYQTHQEIDLKLFEGWS